MNADAKTNLRAVITEYFAGIDDRLPADKVLELLIDAATKPTSEQPLVIQLHIEGTRANRLYKTPSNAFTEDDQRFWTGVDDFRTREP